MINKVHNMDCIEGLRLLEDNSIDSIVTDPPYELGFMGKAWDSTGIAYNVELWKQCLRVLKPGGHLLSFGGTRTYHRMACAIEDAGFEIRDQIQWIYGSGFPKSHNISKALDGTLGKQGKGFVSAGDDGRKAEFKQDLSYRSDYGYIYEPATPEAKQWQGFGTALKPANEPIVLARKPLSERTIASNALRWGCGGLNIDGCRVGTETIVTHGKRNGTGNSLELSKYTSPENYEGNVHQGRFPANVILDEYAGKALDEQSGLRPSGKGNGNAKVGEGLNGAIPMMNRGTLVSRDDVGGASRFFYCAKSSKAERNLGCEGLITWEGVELSPLMAKLNQQLKDISEFTMQNQSDIECNMILSGSNTMEQSQTDTMSTILTKTKLTTILEILYSLTNCPTKKSIRGALKTMKDNGTNLAETVESLNHWKQSITNEKVQYLLGVVSVALTMLSQIKNLGRQGNVHSTVKPQKLMEHLVTMVTPPNGVVLDPFAGSGSTLVAAKGLGFNYIGFELSKEYCDIIDLRISSVQNGHTLTQEALQ